ncbi:MAG TPA: DUF4126 domain-containing protein, partial [Casimicrobiaceae bacterium]|nr:DUF4126 domain-containing protein [Casimicrobiaceae bacterium]
VHTVIRIPAGAALAASVFGDQPGAWMIGAAILGGTLAAGSHLAKAGSRALINTSPEPFSNWAASFAEDVGVGVILWLAFVHPLVALVVSIALIALLVWLIPKLWHAGRRVIASVSASFGRLRGAGAARDRS